ncbi:MAG: hypothetical protein OCD02_15445 [Spirochaetaceae bacterium]
MKDYILSSQYYFIKVLIIDEVLYTKRNLSKEFRDIGCFVFSANSGADAIDKIKKYKPDIITINRDLTDMTMECLINQVLTFVSRASTKIILVTTKKDDQPKLPPYIDGFISLPISKQDLENLVNRNCYR